MYSLGQSFFFLAFCVVLFLLIIFGETPYGIALLGILVGLLVVCQLWQQKQEVTIQMVFSQTPILLFTGVTAIAFLSFLFTESVPLTLNKAMTVLTSWVLMVWLLQRQKQWQLPELLGIGVIFISSVLLMLSAVLSAVPQLSQHLPSMNQLIANYGHNHAAIWYVISLPLTMTWWLKLRRPWWGTFFILAFISGIVLSFGRVMIVEALLVFMMMGWPLRRFAPPWLLGMALLPILIAIAVVGYFSFFFPTSSYGDCSLPILRAQLCKPLATESRVHYWGQALRAIAREPWFGTGGGTFGQVSRRLADFSYQYSAYTHNEHLQFAVEYGLIAAVVWIVFWLLVARQAGRTWWRTVRRRHENWSPSWSTAWSVVVLVLLFDSLFDYNWQFVAVWLTLITAVAMTLVVEKESPSPSPRHSFFPGIWLCAGGVVIIWSSCYLLSVGLWRTGNIQASLRTFPLVYWKVEEIIGTPFLDRETSEFLTTLYWSHDVVLAKRIRHEFGDGLFLTEEVPSETTWQKLRDDHRVRPILERLVALSPNSEAYWFALYRVTYAQQDWPTLAVQLQAISDRFVDDRSWLLSWPAREKISRAAALAAQDAAAQQQTAVADKLGQLSTSIIKSTW